MARIAARRHAFSGALTGLLLSAILIAVSFLGWKVAGLPFAPFDIFDWIVRLLPGVVVTAALDTTVALIRISGITSIGAAAKAGDQTLAIVGLLSTGVVLGAALFVTLSLSDEPALMFGGIFGAMLGGLALMAEHQLQRLAPTSMVGAAWVFLTCMAWGIGFGWTHDRLKRSSLEEGDAEARVRRRRLLRMLAALAVTTSTVSVVAGILADRLGRRAERRRWSDDHALPNAEADVVPVRGTRAEFTPIENFYRIDTDTRAPSLDADRWRLAIDGLVDRPQLLTLADLRALDPIELFATLCCISNPPGGDLISTTRWTGVSLKRLLPRLGLQPSATHLRVVSADGFFESLALDAILADERIMLAYAWDGVSLPVEHGYPLRLYVPDLYGMKQPKWIVGLHAIERWEPGYWVERGWSKDGRVLPMSAIDAANRTRDGAFELGGVAFAGARGISRVEVRLDDGEWREATMRPPLSNLSWVIWRATLPATPGQHLVAARAFDGQGATQSEPMHSRRTTT